MDDILQAEDDGQALINANENNAEPHERFNPLAETTPNLSSTALYHIPSLCNLVLSCMALVIFTSGLLISSYPYLQAVNGPSDSYNGLLAVLCFSFLPVMLCLQFKISFLHREPFLLPESITYISKLGAIYGLSLLLIVNSITDLKVLCHLQEPLMGLVLIYLIVIYFVYKGPEMSPMKMFCLCGLLGSLFLCLDYQLNDVYTCRGRTRNTAVDDGGDWSKEAHTLWMIVYAGAIFCLTLSWLLMEKEILLKKNERMSSRISRASNTNASQAGDMEALLDASYEGVPETGFEGRPLTLPSYSSIIARWDTHLFWFLLSTFLFVLAMFWTDFIPSMGKASSVEELAGNFVQAFHCHFSLSEECGMVWLYGWIFIFSHIGFLVALGYVFANSGSMIFALSVTSLSLPISSLFWTVFEIGGSSGVLYHPKASGPLIFTSLGIPLMVFCICYWVCVDRQEKKENNRVLVV